MSKAPLGGEKTGPNPTDRGKDGTKRSVLTEACGIPIALALAVDGANRNDFKMARATFESLAVKRPRPTRNASQGLCHDKGYDSDETRALLKEFPLPRTFAAEAKKPRPSSARLASRLGVGSLNEPTAG